MAGQSLPRNCTIKRQEGRQGEACGLMALDAGTWDGGHVTTLSLPLPKAGAEGVEGVCTRLRGRDRGQRCTPVPSWYPWICAESYVTLCTRTGDHEIAHRECPREDRRGQARRTQSSFEFAP